MKCDEYQEQVSALIDAELGDRSSPLLFEHLAGCVDCRSFLDSALQLRHLMYLGASPELAAAPKDVRLNAGLQMSADRPAVRYLKRKISMSVATAAALIVLFAGSSAFFAAHYYSKPKIVERQIQSTVYMVQLPQVEIKDYYPPKVKSN